MQLIAQTQKVSSDLAQLQSAAAQVQQACSTGGDPSTAYASAAAAFNQLTQDAQTLDHARQNDQFVFNLLLPRLTGKSDGGDAFFVLDFAFNGLNAERTFNDAQTQADALIAAAQPNGCPSIQSHQNLSPF
jgi:hypothetical protein